MSETPLSLSVYPSILSVIVGGGASNRSGRVFRKKVGLKSIHYYISETGMDLEMAIFIVRYFGGYQLVGSCSSSIVEFYCS